LQPARQFGVHTGVAAAPNIMAICASSGRLSAADSANIASCRRHAVRSAASRAASPSAPA
jgi:hypothetical protein